MKKITNQNGFAITSFLYSIFLLIVLFLILIILLIANNSIGYFKFQKSIKDNLDEISYDKTEINDYAKIIFEEEAPIILKGETFNLLEGVNLIRYDGVEGEITSYESSPQFNNNIPGKYVITYRGIIDNKNFTKKRVITVKELNNTNELLFSSVKINNSTNINKNNTTIKYSATTITPTISLSKSDINSSVTFDIIINNSTNDDYFFSNISYDETTYNNNITFDLTNLEIGDKILKGEDLKIQIKFYYNNVNIEEQNFDNILKTSINFNFLEVPIFELNKDIETFTINNMYPGYYQDFNFEVTNYNEQQINKVPLTYSISNTQVAPFSMKIYDTNKQEVVESITLVGDGKTKTTQTYTLRIYWEYQENIDYSNYEKQTYSIQTNLKAIPINQEYIDDYSIEKNFNTNIDIAPFYFTANTQNSTTIINDTATLPINVNNYISNTEYNIFDTNYEISLEGNENFTLSIDGITATNNSITIKGEDKTTDKFNVILNADTTNLNVTENLNLKVKTTKPYAKTITFPITVNLYPITVTLEPNGGTLNSTTITVYNGKNYSNLPTLTRTGYSFEGWYTDVETGIKYDTETIVDFEIPTLKLYAKWKVLPIAINDIPTITMTQEEAKNYYGKIVSTINGSTFNPNSNDLRTWRIFYIDTNNKYGDGKGTIYLKADEVASKTLSFSTTFETTQIDGYTSKFTTKSNTRYYKISGNNVVNSSGTTIDTLYLKLNPLYATGRKNISSTTFYEAEKAAAYLCDKTQFTAYTDNRTNYAIGSPPIEMWIDSWNSVYGSDYKFYYRYNKNVDGTTANTKLPGYELNFNNDTWSTAAGQTIDIKTIDTTGMYASSKGMWYASPSVIYMGGSLIRLSSGGYIGNATINQSFTYSPIVSLNSQCYVYTK